MKLTVLSESLAAALTGDNNKKQLPCQNLHCGPQIINPTHQRRVLFENVFSYQKFAAMKKKDNLFRREEHLSSLLQKELKKKKRLGKRVSYSTTK